MTTQNSKVVIQSTDSKLSRKRLAFVRKHVAKLESLSDRIIEIRVSLKIDADAESNKVCEISVSVPGKDLFVSKKSDTFEESVDLSVDALKHQLESWKATIAGRNRNFRESIDAP
jgi:ribosome-associated translation inhibitor RaiA